MRDPSADISAEEASLAENVHRASLHPFDQFRAFQALRQKGQSKEEIAAAFFVGVNVVKQRLRPAAVSEKLLDIYAEDGMYAARDIRLDWGALHRRHGLGADNGVCRALPLRPGGASQSNSQPVLTGATRQG